MNGAASPDQVVRHRAWREAHDQVLTAVRAGHGIVLLSGPTGAGKSLLLAELSRTLREAGFDALLQPRGDAPINPGQVRPRGVGEAASRVVLIDEAHRMNAAALGQLGRLGARSFVLAVPAGPGIWPRDAAVVHLAPLQSGEVGGFVAVRLAQAGQPADRVSHGAVARLAERSDGVPGVLVRLIGAALFLAGADKVEAAHVDAAASRGDAAEAAGPSASPSAVPPSADPALRPPKQAQAGTPVRTRAAAFGVAAGVAAICSWMALRTGGRVPEVPPVMTGQVVLAEMPIQPEPAAARPEQQAAAPVPPEQTPTQPEPAAARPEQGAAAPVPPPPAPPEQTPTQPDPAVTPPEQQAAAPAVPPTAPDQLPSGAPAWVALHYARGDAAAASRATDLALSLRRAGFSVDGPVAITGRGRPGVHYFFAEDRGAAEAVLRSANLQGGGLLAGAAGRNPPPRPGTIELIVSSN